MKRLIVLLLISASLFSCTKNVIEREREQIIGEWVLDRTMYSPDDEQRFRQESSRVGWRLRFSEDGTFEGLRDNKSVKGNYFVARSQFHFSLLNDSNEVVEQWLWYDTHVSKRSMGGTTMEKDGEYSMTWERP